jgi:hypothetical protein
MATSTSQYPSNVVAEGRAVGAFKVKSFTSAKGKPITVLEGKIVSGETFVNVTQFLNAGDIPYLPSHDEKVKVVVVPGFKDDGVIHIEGIIVRPDLANDAGKNPASK